MAGIARCIGSGKSRKVCVTASCCGAIGAAVAAGLMVREAASTDAVADTATDAGVATMLAADAADADAGVDVAMGAAAAGCGKAGAIEMCCAPVPAEPDCGLDVATATAAVGMTVGVGGAGVTAAA